MAGFFSTAELASSAPQAELPKCRACGLYRGCEHPKIPVWGEGRKGILIIGEAPGKNTDARRTQFDKTDVMLKEALRKVGVDYQRDCWVTYAAICRPPSNRTPSVAEVEYCRPNLTRALRELKPRVVVPLGTQSIRSVLTGLWREDVGELDRWVGWRIPDRTTNTWICPTWHPMRIKWRDDDPVMSLWWHRHLEAIAKLDDRPYYPDGPEDLERHIEVITDPAHAARRIHGLMMLHDFPVSFDYETNCLKPETLGAEIVCCSVCWGGKTTVAYPWAGEAISATSALLRSDCPKRGHNIKFESRWTKRFLGNRVRRWQWDSMQAAHVLDNRPGVTGLKFQAYVRLGYPEYDAAVRPFLESGEGGLNRIRRVPIDKVLRYCALDSLLEYRLSEIQMRELKGVRDAGSFEDT